MATEQTLVLIKPDGVQRGLIGEVIKRFEQRGLKIVGLKLTHADNDLAQRHYTEDITKRRGKKVRNKLLEFITSGPVIAMVIEGVSAIENVRKIVGETESKSAQPGTIRGDFSHVSYAHADEKGIPVKNIIHASSNEEDAKSELALWFSVDEIHSYKRSEDEHVI
ncbi:MAG: nucleoside-diphosphate kinase [Nanoarchaeota archaeon]|nr:nucleoside-diphosphate kinase [Nanoarchaeota archaeon]